MQHYKIHLRTDYACPWSTSRSSYQREHKVAIFLRIGFVGAMCLPGSMPHKATPPPKLGFSHAAEQVCDSLAQCAHGDAFL